MKQKSDIQRLLLVLLGAFVMALNIRIFVRAGDMFPGGFNGLTLLIQRTASQYLHIELPFSLINLLLNAAPAVISFLYIGKKFTLYSGLMIVVSSILTDLLPGFEITSDPLLISIFGGIINGCAISLCLFANATSGGTDFIAIFFSERKGIDTWNYIFLGNVAMLIVAGLLFGWDKSLYSIIFQFASTQILHMLYKRYQKQTLLIITDHPQEIYQTIRDNTHHDATQFEGVGCYEGQEKHMLYSVVSADEAKRTIDGIRKVDPAAFINCLKTEQITGRFYNRPND
ncbi:MAG TPA: YitT family protein [Firmicutes bacterium]|nr:YitT family protein [Bacillota bacterium]